MFWKRRGGGDAGVNYAVYISSDLVYFFSVLLIMLSENWAYASSSIEFIIAQKIIGYDIKS